MLSVGLDKDKKPTSVSVVSDDVPMDEPCKSNACLDDQEPSSVVHMTEHSYSLPETNCSVCEDLYLQLQVERMKNRELMELIEQRNANPPREPPKTSKSTHSSVGNIIMRFIKSDERVRQNTGLPNKKTLDAFYRHVQHKVEKMRYWTGKKKSKIFGSRNFRKTPKKFGPSRKLTSREELILVLMKLRQGINNSLLSSIFGISLSTCSQVFNTWIKFLARELKPLLFWPDHDTISNMLTISMVKKYPRLRCT